MLSSFLRIGMFFILACGFLSPFRISKPPSLHVFTCTPPKFSKYSTKKKTHASFLENIPPIISSTTSNSCWTRSCFQRQRCILLPLPSVIALLRRLFDNFAFVFPNAFVLTKSVSICLWTQPFFYPNAFVHLSYASALYADALGSFLSLTLFPCIYLTLSTLNLTLPLHFLTFHRWKK